jgi:hypothetical protein
MFSLRLYTSISIQFNGRSSFLILDITLIYNDQKTHLFSKNSIEYLVEYGIKDVSDICRRREIL